MTVLISSLIFILAVFASSTYPLELSEASIEATTGEITTTGAVTPLSTINISTWLSDFTSGLYSQDQLQVKHVSLIIEWRDAMKNKGAILMEGHGASIEVETALRTEAKNFFHQAFEKKMLHNHGYYGNPLGGYTPPGEEAVIKSNADFHDKEHAKFDPLENWLYHYQPSMYNYMYHSHKDEHKDELLQSLTLAADAYFNATLLLLPAMHALSALALGQPDMHFFDQYYNWSHPSNVPFHQTHSSVDPNFVGFENPLAFKLAHYLQRSSPLLLGNAPTSTHPHGLHPHTVNKDYSTDTLYGPHKDYMGFTMVLPDPSDWNDVQAGLEMFDPLVSQWLPVHVPSCMNGLVVICGELLSRWTGGFWTSPMHRVVAPSSDTERYSFMVFSSPLHHKMIETLPVMVEGKEAVTIDYEPITAGEWFIQKFGPSVMN